MLQDYEGATELILLYHHADEQAAALVEQYSNGSSIRGVVARGGAVFPTTADLRYAAWTARADIIANWDFLEFHLPDRLSVQVRAMAVGRRPASVLIHDPKMPGRIRRGHLK